MSKTYIAVIADAVNSRRLPPKERARLQADLRADVSEFNRTYRSSLAARFAVTLGDELQCLLKDPSDLWSITHHIRYKFAEVDWVIACGRGGVTTPLSAGISAPEVDGPCFHEARAALEAAKRERRILVFGGFANPALDAFSAYYAALYWTWTARQRPLASKWRAWGALEARLPLRVREGIHPSGISHLRRRMAWPLVEAGDKMFQAVLEAS